MATITLEEVRAWDAADPLACFRERFALPEGVIYLDGNSLGALPKATIAAQRDAVERQWGQDLIGSWNDNRWIDAPQRIGGKIARIIGADPNEVIVADSTSINLFKLLVATARLSDARPVILSEAGNFPTDLHIAEGAAKLLGKELRVVGRGEVTGAIGPQVAALILTHVHYRTGERFDMAAMTAQARAAGVPVIWDLSHSVGAVPIDLHAAGAQFAIGCGYKYLNGGPGAPAFLYAARAAQPALDTPLSGWMGHEAPFAFEDGYRPAPGMDRFLCGTPPMLSLLALEQGIDLFLEADPQAIAAKSARLFDLFAERVAARCSGHDLTLVTPKVAQARGSHISYAHPHAYGLVQALIARGIVGDFRTPDVARFGLTPLYLRHEDIWNAVEALADVLESGAHRDPAFARRNKVT